MKTAADEAADLIKASLVIADALERQAIPDNALIAMLEKRGYRVLVPLRGQSAATAPQMHPSRGQS